MAWVDRRTFLQTNAALVASAMAGERVHVQSCLSMGWGSTTPRLVRRLSFSRGLIALSQWTCAATAQVMLPSRSTRCRF